MGYTLLYPRLASNSSQLFCFSLPSARIIKHLFQLPGSPRHPFKSASIATPPCMILLVVVFYFFLTDFGEGRKVSMPSLLSRTHSLHLACFRVQLPYRARNAERHHSVNVLQSLRHSLNSPPHGHHETFDILSPVAFCYGLFSSLLSQGIHALSLDHGCIPGSVPSFRLLPL